MSKRAAAEICFPESKTTRTLVSQCNESYEVKVTAAKSPAGRPRLFTAAIAAP
ncbi:MAG: hypothetical protein ABIN80_13540 [Dyadobacter sp.]|uniref:hypothetical protein n=1 Tax=Dyadobacter sp. TaxID=1914288 RepID=UPI003263CB64